MHLAVSIVSQVSIDWTRIGWSPPTVTPPTLTWRDGAPRISVKTATIARGSLGLFGHFLLPCDKHVSDVEEGHVKHETNQEHGASRLDRFEDANVDRLAANALDNGKNDMPAVEDRERQAD